MKSNKIFTAVIIITCAVTFYGVSVYQKSHLPVSFARCAENSQSEHLNTGEG
jgi:hypothetical protein